MNNKGIIDLATAQELAAALKCSEATICRKTQAGVFPEGSVYRFGSMKRYDLKMILESGKNNDKKYRQSPLVIANRSRKR